MGQSPTLKGFSCNYVGKSNVGSGLLFSGSTLPCPTLMSLDRWIVLELSHQPLEATCLSSPPLEGGSWRGEVSGLMSHLVGCRAYPLSNRWSAKKGVLMLQEARDKCIYIYIHIYIYVYTYIEAWISRRLISESSQADRQDIL